MIKFDFSLVVKVYIGLIKAKLFLCLINQALCYEDTRGSGGVAPPFLNSALDGGEWSASRPGHLTPGTHRIAGWAGHRADLVDMERGKKPLLGFDPGLSSS
jgi:hypothetical protein